ncbi:MULTISPECIES: lipase family protein [Streptomycetaceae]|uniref:Uncharacterized protein n=1 Tax=Streptantibioticus cattleyicolor (strain ATCC 35852 / DSM 46488 / JCM 4925 / NBRC 14057 / NRRL 8057) TaxID=1003195 RepID=F8JNZ4_STREN|nr:MULTISPECIES: hypothetical protein [Streptomycetaceae]AEW93935.1 hypothetical protein SCATT_15640 [Streptantibioticus cattleyicolor NRRL 8057 = DSM 46488]MYS58611.1 hypothetical protein [Streptomyces sp. SID5468]CCB74281.1 conserved protein of unknown function [Streptantibioticus cattleyicolor NRRL 8057 = DSM 46488]
MTSVVFVHGTGVRAESYERTHEKVVRGLAAARPDATVVRCYWGDAFGARLALGGVSIPVREGTRAVPGEAAADDPTALWSLLLADPFAELHAHAAAAPRQAGGFVPGRADPWRAFADRVRSLPAALAASGGAAEPGSGTARLLPEAAERTAREIAALSGGAPDDAGVTAVTARAVVAETLRLAAGEEPAQEPPPVDGEERDALVAAITEALGGTDRGALADAGRWLLRRGLTWAVWDYSEAARRHRTRITGGAVPATGDILRYQARGEALRDRVAETVRAARAADPGRPVVLLAHSLGGIACVDLLATDPGLRVDLLVTVGSQAPFLYELDALTGLRRGEPLPPAFPRWLNVYDERDLLGFVAAGIFPGRVRDLRVDTRQPFPWSHSAYFAHRGFYRLLAPELP